jgi:hypothetical protein
MPAGTVSSISVPHTAHAPVPASLRLLEPLGLETGTIIANAQGEYPVTKRQLGLDGVRARVLSGISERLLRNAVSLLAHTWNERTSLSFQNYPERDGLNRGGIFRE